MEHVSEIGEKYTIIDEIGQGAYGAVCKAKELSSNQIVALKRVQREKLQNGFPENAIREIKILNSLNRSNQKNIIKLRTVVTCGKNKDVYLVFDYCPYDLQALIANNNKKGLSEEQTKSYFRQILLAIYSCHVKNIIHRDIKPSNVFIQNNNVVRMGDFGMARYYPPNQEVHESQPWNVVTIWYRAPELLMGAKKYGPEIDVWSLGCVLYEMITGRVLFTPRKNESYEQLERIIQICGPINEEEWPEVKNLQFYNKFYEPVMRARAEAPHLFHPSLQHYLSEVLGPGHEAIPLLVNLLQLTPSHRMTVKDAFLHTYLSSPDGCYEPYRLGELHLNDTHAMTFTRKEADPQREAAVRPTQQDLR